MNAIKQHVDACSDQEASNEQICSDQEASSEQVCNCIDQACIDKKP